MTKFNFQTISSSFYLRKCTPLPRTMELLTRLYPTVNWSRVDFYEGLPWFTPTVAPYVTAQALPHFYSTHKFCIYLKKFDETRVQCLADIVHEAFHVLQAMHFKRGWGLGFLRGWILYYIAYFIKHGYRNNPFEIPAYDQEYRFLDKCLKHGLHGIKPQADTESLLSVTNETDLVYSGIHFKYSGNKFLLAVSCLLCLLITVIRPLTDLLVGAMRLVMVNRTNKINSK